MSFYFSFFFFFNKGYFSVSIVDIYDLVRIELKKKVLIKLLLAVK